MAAMLFDIRAVAVIVIVLVMITVEVYGFMGLAGIKLSAFPAVRVMLSVGVGMEFTVHMTMVCCLSVLCDIRPLSSRSNQIVKN